MTKHFSILVFTLFFLGKSGSFTAPGPRKCFVVQCNKNKSLFPRQKVFTALDDLTTLRGKATTTATTTTVLKAAGVDDDVYSIEKSNIPYGILWAALLGFAAFVAPGEMNSSYDLGIVQAIIDNPQQPDINGLFYMVFNQFVIMSASLACLTFPQASKKGPPALPFLLASVFAGYFVYAPYLVLRGQPKQETTLEDLDWTTRNILENKFFNAGMVALSLFFVSQVSWGDLSSLAQGYADMASMSKLVSVASVDLTLLSLTAAALIPQDYKLRNPDGADKANLIAASTLLLPVLGSAIYCLVRPKLAEE